MRSIFGKWLHGKPAAPNQFDSLYNRANDAATHQDFTRATDLYDQAIAANPSSAEAYYKRGNALRNLSHFDAAIASYTEAIKLKADYAYAYCNRGVVEHRRGLTAAALKSYDQGIALDPTDTMAHYNRALLMQDLSRWDEALASYDRALTINPNFADAQYNRALALLFQGDFENGWRGYESRWKNAHRLAIGQPRNFAQPLWLGDPLSQGTRLLLWSEGGLGDTLQFCRYAALSAVRGATVILEVQAPLLDLLTHLDGVSQVISRGSALPRFDYHCPLMSLPLAFNTRVDTIPAPRHYLRRNELNIARCKMLLGAQTRPRVGLAWSGNPNNPIDEHRSIQLSAWTARLPPEFQYFCLQREVRPADQAVIDSGSLITSFDSDQLGFVDTAALCACMDVVVSVDTSVAHLSGALGQRTWILLPFTPDWRWMRGRDDSPWYPTAKLYRQKAAGDWNDVFERIATDLRRDL